METWKNTAIIACVNQTGEPLTVIEQCRVDRINRTLQQSDGSDRGRRFVLGNGARVDQIDARSFILSGSHEVLIRCLAIDGDQSQADYSSSA